MAGGEQVLDWKLCHTAIDGGAIENKTEKRGDLFLNMGLN